MLLGIVMGIRQDFQLVPVHAHINLVGFAAHCVFGLIYNTWPILKESAMAVAQFWLFVVGSPLLMVGITIATKTNNVTLAIVGSILVFLGALLLLVMTGPSLLRASKAPAPWFSLQHLTTAYTGNHPLPVGAFRLLCRIKRRRDAASERPQAIGRTPMICSARASRETGQIVTARRFSRARPFSHRRRYFA